MRRLSSLKPDLLLAADCCYIDQDGQSPSTPHFIQACKGQAGAVLLLLLLAAALQLLAGSR